MSQQETQGYQGWTNYPTWAVALWINNNQALQARAHELARGLEGRELADALLDLIGDVLPDMGGLEGDLLTWAVGQSNWRELAVSFREDAQEIGS